MSGSILSILELMAWNGKNSLYILIVIANEMIQSNSNTVGFSCERSDALRVKFGLQSR